MPVREQTTNPYDDASCRFYGVGASYAALSFDLSQLEDSVLSDASAIFENSARFNHGSPRTLLFHFGGLTTADSGTLWRHGNGANLELLSLTGLGTIRVLVNNVERLLWTLPTILGSAWIAWVSEANPDPDASASEAVQSWIFVHSETTGESFRVRFVHPAKTLESVTAYVGASSSGGASAVTEQIDTFGFFSRLFSLTELALTHWEARVSPSTVAATERQGLPVTSGTIDVVDEPHGPAAQLATAALRHTRWRTMGALCNARFRNVPTITRATEDTGDDVSKIRNALGSSVYRMHLGWFRSYPVSPTANALFVRVHARVWSIVPGLETGYWGLRLYAFSRRPVIGQSFVDEGELPEPLQWRFAEEEVADDNDASSDPGDWRIETVIPIVRGSSGISRDRVYLALAYAVDPAETNTVPDEDLRLQVRAIHVVQLFDATVGQPPLGGPSGEAG